jgi:hypothetical protein
MKRVLSIGCSYALFSVTADCFIYKNINRKDEVVKINEKGIKKIKIHLVYSVYIFLNINRVDEQDDEWKREETMKFSRTPNSSPQQIQQHTIFSNAPTIATHQIQQHNKVSTTPNSAPHQIQQHTTFRIA